MITTDESILRKKSHNTSIAECGREKIFERLAEALRKSDRPGVGLAAIQIGVPLRAALVNIPGMKMGLINPVIVERGPEKIFPGEGCLSVPGKEVSTKRNEWVAVEYANDAGIRRKATFKGVVAIIMQHEIDHMDGILITDREYKSKNKVGRNEPCPECLKEGITIKFKKCKKHFK